MTKIELLYNFYYIYLCQPDQCDIKGYFLVEVLCFLFAQEA